MNTGIMNPERLEWDEYFMSIAVLAACRSPCTRLHVGSVVVKDKRIVAMGYNGFLPGCNTNRIFATAMNKPLFIVK